MKTALIIILCGIIGISASVVSSRIISQPATPKQIYCKVYNSMFEARNDIIDKTKRGWIVKSVSATSKPYASTGNESFTIIVLEKY